MSTEPQLITVEDRSARLSSNDVFNVVWAVNHQVVFHYGRSAWVTQGLAPPAHVVYLQPKMVPPPGAWNLILMDHSDQQGALGYHQDENGTDIPYAEVFVMDTLQDGSTVSAVASHEALEMLVDPDVSTVRTQLREDTQELYIVEACDAVQGCDYDVGAPEGRVTGTKVSDFCLPSWWTMEPSGAPYSFRNSVAAPWELAPQGYISTALASDPNKWRQVFGSQIDSLPRWASRLPRIHGPAPAAPATPPAPTGAVV